MGISSPLLDLISRLSHLTSIAAKRRGWTILANTTRSSETGLIWSGLKGATAKRAGIIFMLLISLADRRLWNNQPTNGKRIFVRRTALAFFGHLCGWQAITPLTLPVLIPIPGLLRIPLKPCWRKKSGLGLRSSNE